MPEYPNPKLRAIIPPPRLPAGASAAYAELDVTTNFSFLRGASHPDELVFRATELGYRAIAITDVNSLAGVVRAFSACRMVREQGGTPPKLIIGSRLVFSDGTPDLLAWAPDRGAYARLCRLLTLGKRRAEKGECSLTLDDFLDHSQGLLAAIAGVTLVSPSSSSMTSTHDQGRGKPRPYRGIEGGRGMPRPYGVLREAMGDRVSVAACAMYGNDDRSHLASLHDLSRQSGIPLVATNHVHYHEPGRRRLQDVLACVRHGCSISEAGLRLFANGERYLKEPAQMRRLFSDYPQAIGRGLEIAERCAFSLDELRYEYPREVVPAGRTAIGHLRELAWAGAAERYPGGIPAKVRDLIAHELALIEQLHFEAYFLTVHDLVRFARSRGILCQGRGSAANSAVCYCIGVTSVDPARINLLFERFISAARNEPPDIDVDFEHERREEVIQYVYEKYGRERAGMTAEVISYRGRSAVRDVGKAMGLSLDLVDRMAKKLDWWHRGSLTDEYLKELGLDPGDGTIRRVIDLSTELLGFPRHLSQHVGGLVMTQTPLNELVPIENAAMADRTVIEWDKDDIDAVGMLKVDVLGLGMLTCISRAFGFVNGEGNQPQMHTDGHRWGEVKPEARNPNAESMTNDECPNDETHVPHELRHSSFGFDSDFGLRISDSSSVSICAPSVADTSPVPRKFELHTIPPEDPAVYEMISDADTIGVFQIESRAQMSMLPRLRPRNFYDLVIEVAIVRPGPIQGNMVHPYLRRRNGEEPVSYPSDALRQVLEKTLGVPLFQEQAMRIAMVGAGFSAGEADRLRRAMAAWRKNGALEGFHQKIVDGMLANGYTREFAEQCFMQIRGFGEYGFPESHAASFALLVYVSAFLKRYHPAAFCAALLNSQPMGFYAPAQIVRDAKEHGVEARSADVNCSDWDCVLETDLTTESTEKREKNQPQMNTDEHRWERQIDPIASVFSDSSVAEINSASVLSVSSVVKSEWGKDGPAVRLGFRQIKGLREGDARRLVDSRKRFGQFRSIDELHCRTRLSKSTLTRLAEADAFSSMGLSRRQALWEVMEVDDRQFPLFEEGSGFRVRGSVKNLLPVMPLGQEVMTDYATTGLTLRKHPVALVREHLAEKKIITSREMQELRHGTWVRVAGLVLIRQRPGTARGIVFETLEDETGIINLIIRPNIYDRYRLAARHAGLLHAEGYLERQGQVIHVMVWRMNDLSHLLRGYQFESRDFH